MENNKRLPQVSMFSWFLFSIVLSLSGCVNASPKSSLALLGYNHTESEIANYEITSFKETTGGGFIPAGKGGGSMTCCVVLPTLWTEGLVVTVTKGTFDGKSWTYVEKNVAVPKYDMKTAAFFNVHFLHDGGIKVFATNMVLGNRNYPLKGLEAQLKPGVPIKFIN
jgi:hypothetical protein